jgi:hypothetical protein
MTHVPISKQRTSRRGGGGVACCGAIVKMFGFGGLFVWSVTSYNTLYSPLRNCIEQRQAGDVITSLDLISKLLAHPRARKKAKQIWIVHWSGWFQLSPPPPKHDHNWLRAGCRRRHITTAPLLHCRSRSSPISRFSTGMVVLFLHIQNYLILVT